MNIALPVPAVLLLGPTGSGKSPLGDLLEQAEALAACVRPERAPAA